MSKSNRVTMTRLSTEDKWPFDVFKTNLENNFSTIESAGVQTWILGDKFTALTLVVDHVVEHDDLFETYQEFKPMVIPLWISAESTSANAAFYIANHLTVTEEIVQDPDLTGYVRITFASAG
jgi:hypothetical protein